MIDELGAAMDANTEEFVNNLVDQLFPSTTLLAITHHMKGIHRFDRYQTIVCKCSCKRKKYKTENPGLPGTHF